MVRPLHLLLIEDLEDDALLILRELRRAGYEPTWERVDTAAALSAALAAQTWDIITCDWVMPQFSATDALELLKQHRVDVPIIIVSGEVGEEVAVTAMKSGAHDFVSKFRMTRLVPAIERELREADGRRTQRRAEEALERERELVTSVLDTVGALVGVVDREGRIVRFNRACEQTLGYSFDEVRGRPFWDLLPVAGEVGPAKAVFERLLAGKWPMQYETYWYTRQGGRIRLAWSTRFLTNAAGEAEYVIGSGIDITERKRSEDALRASETRFRSLIEKSLDLIAIIDADGAYRYVNPAHEAAYGSRVDDLVGTNAFETLHPDDARELAARLAEAIRSGETMATVEYRIRHKDGSWHFIEGIALNLLDDPVVAGLLVTGRDITERRLADQRVADALNYSQTMLDASPVGIIAYTASGDVVSTNAAAARLIGATIDQVKAQNFRRLKSWRESGLLAAAEKALATGQEQQIETHLTSTFGKPVWLAMRLVPFQFAGETRLLTLSMDVGDRKLAEKELRRNEERLRVGVRVADIAVFNQDRELRYTWMYNPQLGYTTDRVLGKTDAELLPARDAGRIMALKRRVLETNKGAREEVHVTKDGRVLVYDLALEPLRDATGAVVGLTGASFDITDRKHAEEALAKTAQYLATAQSIAHVGSWEWNIETGELLWSDETRRIFGLQPGQVDPRYGRALQFAHPHDRERYEATLQRAVESGGTFSVEIRIVRADATEGTVIVAGGVFGAEDGQPRTFIGVVQDISERKRAEDEIRALNEALERRVSERTEELAIINEELEAFSYSVSHDLRAPLRQIEGFSRILLEDYAAQVGAEVKQYLHRIQAGTQRMGQLIEDLLNLSRVTLEQMVRQVVHLSDLAQAIVADLRRSAPNRPVELVIAPGLVAEGDPHLLRVALDNLLGNAWKYTSKHGAARIEFGVIEREGEVVYFVRDDGAGFDMTRAAKLFGAFQRFHSTSEFEGTGVGLAIVQRIIRRHGGRIWAEAEVDKGATFYFTLWAKHSSKNLPQDTSH